MYKQNYNALLKTFKNICLQKKIDKLGKKYKDKKVILYGAGIISDIITTDFDISGLNLIGISDIKFETQLLSDFKGYKVIKPSSLAKEKDAIILIILQEYFRAEDYFKNELFHNYGIFKHDSLLKISLLEFLALKLFSKI